MRFWLRVLFVCVYIFDCFMRLFLFMSVCLFLLRIVCDLLLRLQLTLEYIQKRIWTVHRFQQQQQCIWKNTKYTFVLPSIVVGCDSEYRHLFDSNFMSTRNNIGGKYRKTIQKTMGVWGAQRLHTHDDDDDNHRMAHFYSFTHNEKRNSWRQTLCIRP